MKFMEVLEKVVSHYVAYNFTQGKDAVSSRKFPPVVSAQRIRCTDFHIVTKVYLCNLYPAALRGFSQMASIPKVRMTCKRLGISLSPVILCVLR